jgi:hypothetical protein
MPAGLFSVAMPAPAHGLLRNGQKGNVVALRD